MFYHLRNTIIIIQKYIQYFTRCMHTARVCRVFVACIKCINDTCGTPIGLSWWGNNMGDTDATDNCPVSFVDFPSCLEYDEIIDDAGVIWSNAHQWDAWMYHAKAPELGHVTAVPTGAAPFLNIKLVSFEVPDFRQVAEIWLNDSLSK